MSRAGLVRLLKEFGVLVLDIWAMEVAVRRDPLVHAAARGV
jgi:hypothetical protein